MLAFLDPRYPFIIEPDASDYQLGSIVSQNTKDKLTVEEIRDLFCAKTEILPRNFKPIAFFSRKLNPAQRNYTVGDKEHLSIVETLLEYRTTLLGCIIIAFTDHRNLTSKKSQRVARWELITEEYGCKIFHRAGSHNFAADALSRLSMEEPDQPKMGETRAQIRFEDSYLYYPVQYRLNARTPLEFQNIERFQAQSQELTNLLNTKPQLYRKRPFGNHELVCTRKDPESNAWRIVIPQALVPAVLNWYHTILVHPGSKRMFNTISSIFRFSNMQSRIEAYCKTCDVCQRVGLHTPRLGQLPIKDLEQLPWEEVQTDLCGPWEFKVTPRLKFKFHMLTTIDPFTGLLVMEPINNKTCAHVATTFYNSWICEYPLPQRCIHDNGSEFIGEEFRNLLAYYGIHNVTTSVKNPQANSIIERVHQGMAQMLRAMQQEFITHQYRLVENDVPDFIRTSVKSVQHAINATTHTTTKTTPGAFVFNRDMLLPIQCFTSWEAVRNAKQSQANRNLNYENACRRNHDWQPGESVLLTELDKNKLMPRATGPYVIIRVHTNGTATIQKGRVLERVNIRRLKPYNRR